MPELGGLVGGRVGGPKMAVGVEQSEKAAQKGGVVR